MNYLYLITEDDNDDLFFEGCLENLTGLTFQVDNTRRRLRKGGGIKEAQRMLRLVLQEIRRFGSQEKYILSLLSIMTERLNIRYSSSFQG